jgi:hypothetical protein
MPTKDWPIELQDSEWADLDVSALSSFSSPTLLTEEDQSPPWFPGQVPRSL